MKRKLLIKSAQYWFDIAHDKSTVTKSEDRVFAMEQAYNHAETAIAWLFEKSTPETKAEFLKIQE